MSPPLVTVVIPVYNCEQYVAQTLQSVLSQAGVELEVVCVDDGSTDSSARTVESIADPRIRLIRQANSGRPAVPRNVALAHARGKYVAIFDSDDVMLEGKLRTAVDALETQAEAGWCFSDFRRQSESGVVEGARFLSTYQGFQNLPKHALTNDTYLIAAADCYRGLAYENFVGTSSVVIRKAVLDVVGGFDESLSNGDDRDLWYRLARHSAALYLDRPLHLYRVRSGAISRRGAVNAHARIRVLQKQVAATTDDRLRRQFERRIAANLAGLGYDAKRRGAYPEARRHFIEALRLHPSFGAVRGLAGSLLHLTRSDEPGSQ